MEKEILGIFLTYNPLEDYIDDINRLSSVNCTEIIQASETEEPSDISEGKYVSIGGIITELKTKITKNNQLMAFAKFEDLHSQIELVIFPRTYSNYSYLLDEDKIVLVKGRVNFKEGEIPKILVDSIRGLDRFIF